MSAESSVVSLYVVKVDNDKFFAGFDAEKGQAVYVDNPLAAKKFTNKYDIKLRPSEALVELKVTLSQSNVVVSAPFRPQPRRVASR